MMTGPGDEKAAGASSRGHLRASHADREQVIVTLKAAFIEGRLTKDELDLRVSRTLASRTYAELAALTTDLPGGVAAAPPARTPARAQSAKPEKAAKAAACAGLALALLAAAAFMGPGNGPERLIGLALFFVPVCGLSLGGLLMLHSWLEKHSRGQLPQGPAPGTGVQASQPAKPVTGAGPLPPIDQAPPWMADAAPRRFSRPTLAWLVTTASVAP
jgi:DUF1707 SHOCT-like domain